LISKYKQLRKVWFADVNIMGNVHAIKTVIADIIGGISWHKSKNHLALASRPVY
jgi:hypothetical protein